MNLTAYYISDSSSFLIQRSGIEESYKVRIKVPARAGMTKLNLITEK